MNKFSLEALDNLKELPISPQNLVKVLALLKQETPQIKALTDAVLKDPVLTALVVRSISGLKKASNPKVSLVSQAIIHLGSKNLSKLFYSVNTFDMLNKIHARGLFDLNRFWEEALATALYAKILAEKCRYPSTEQAYVAGLTHHLGLLAMHEMWPNDYESVLSMVRGGGELLNCERTVFGFTHEEAGADVAQSWGLPGSIHRVIGGHHRESKGAQQKSGQLLVDIVHVATQLTQAFLNGKNPSHDLLKGAQLWLEISEQELGNAQNQMQGEWEKIRGGLSIREEDLELYAQLLEKTVARLESQLEDQELRYSLLREKLIYLELQQEASSLLIHCRNREETIKKNGSILFRKLPYHKLGLL